MPATPTYVALAEVNLAATAGSVTLPVPSGYRDIRIVFAGSGSGTADVKLEINGDTTTSNYARVVMWGNGSSTGSLSNSGANDNTYRLTYYGGIASGEISNIEVDIFDCSATDKHKSYLTRSNRAGSGVDAIASRWISTSAVTSLTFTAMGSSFAIGSTFNMYGIEA